jgi:hypothetical protein
MPNPFGSLVSQLYTPILTLQFKASVTAMDGRKKTCNPLNLMARHSIHLIKQQLTFLNLCPVVMNDYR